MEALMGWGERQWVKVARSRLHNFKDQGVRISVAGMLARAGFFDGWDMIESIILRDARYHGIALSQVAQ